MPFSTDTLLRNSYVTFWGDIRIGLLLEDVDRMAGAVAYKHVLGRAEDVIQQLADATSAGPNELAHGDVLQSSPKKVTIVTAGVDSIQLFSKISRFDDIKMRGMVVNTGKSSMDVLVEVQWSLWICIFSKCSRNLLSISLDFRARRKHQKQSNRS
jgi:acyl-coenzyme A thioesterase 9